MKPKTIDELTYDKAMVIELREATIDLRDEALKQTEFGWAITLSRIIVVLGIMLEELES